MFAGLRKGIVMIGAVAAVPAVAAPHPAGNSTPVASFLQTAAKSGTAKILYYKNEDVVKTTATTTRTPIYATVQTPIKNSKGQITGYTTSQKITGYNSVTTKATAITPKAELYTTSGSSTTKSAAPVKFLLSVPDSPYAAILGKPQDALFSLSAVSSTAPALANGVFTQLFSGTLSFTRTAPIYKLDHLGHATTTALTNLLSISFTNAVLTGTANGVTIGLAASTPDSAINFTSDFRQFTRQDWLTNFDFAIAGNAASVALARAAVDPTLTNVTGSRSLNSFRVSTTGTFAASAVPESASWMMMILGFAAIGVARRADVRKIAHVTV